MQDPNMVNIFAFPVMLDLISNNLSYFEKYLPRFVSILGDFESAFIDQIHYCEESLQINLVPKLASICLNVPCYDTEILEFLTKSSRKDSISYDILLSLFFLMTEYARDLAYFRCLEPSAYPPHVFASDFVQRLGNRVEILLNIFLNNFGSISSCQIFSLIVSIGYHGGIESMVKILITFLSMKKFLAGDYRIFEKLVAVFGAKFPCITSKIISKLNFDDCDHKEEEQLVMIINNLRLCLIAERKFPKSRLTYVYSYH
ncbi:hypothetical protein RF11_09262 [Thelohanellus kitauei]|uniref:Uncharacterized protein n=1 Tax=Thelohanellus kitauei TaxID=669202 RepID=A0A0C2J6Q7_THEKT|nr:hypothetical protein RF11_09262 [Thelohanellus kitauei]